MPGLALRLLEAKGGEMDMKDLYSTVTKEEASIALGWLRKKDLATIRKEGGSTTITITNTGQEMLDRKMEDEATLDALSKGDISEDDLDKKTITALKSRQDLVVEKLVVTRTLELTELGREMLEQGIEVREELAQLTPELIQSGKWKDVTIRKYDVRSFAPAIYPGKKHPLTRVADEVRRIFVDMGFQEIDEEYVQPAFWNMDVHPQTIL